MRSRGKEMQQRADFIMMNGTAVRLTSFYQRTLPQDDGPALEEIELVILLRGTMAHRSFLTLLTPSQMRVDVPAAKGDGFLSYEMEIVTAYSSSSGPGEAAAYRHDVTLCETPASAARRAAEQPTVAETTTAAPVLAAEPDID